MSTIEKPHTSANRSTQAPTSSSAAGPEATPVDNSLPVETDVVWSSQCPSTSSADGADREEPPVTQQVPSTEPELAGVRNFRDVGGLPTVNGRRVRSGVL